MMLSGRDNTEKERIRDASDIVRVIGEVCTLRPKGREFVCLCPFHDDHRPSMNIVPHKQIFKCFVCNAGGDVFSFVQKYYHMEFREALEYLAERAGISLTPARREMDEPTTGAPELTRSDLIQANKTAAEFFRTVLKHAEHGESARLVVGRRGISPAMVEAFGLGASPHRWDGLLLTLQSKSLPIEPFVSAGLLKSRDTGGYYDAFRNRLMFPIHDQIGRVIAFGARKIDEADEPKYLNSPETRLFEKSATLYGLFQAAKSIQTERTAIITEGYTDTIACHQAGITNVVATLGTALTRRHAEVLRRLCDTVVLLFDGDQAGQKAADRAVEVFFAEDLDVKIATLSSATDAKDPDELLKREGGAEALRLAIGRATNLLDYRYARIRQQLAGAGMAALNRAVEDDLRRLVDLGFASVPLRRRMLITKKLSSLTGLSESDIARTIPAGRRPDQPRPAPAPTQAPLSIAAQALGCLLCDPGLWASLSDAERELLDPANFELAPQRAVAEAMFDLYARGQPGDVTAVTALLDDPEACSAASDMDRRVSHTTTVGQNHGRNREELRTLLRDCMRLLAGPPESVPLERLRQSRAASNRRVIPRPTG